MRSALTGGSTAFVVDLGGGDVFVAEQLLHFADVDTGIEHESGARSAERVRVVGAVNRALPCPADRGGRPLLPAASPGSSSVVYRS